MKNILRKIGHAAGLAATIITLPITVPAFFIIMALRKNGSGSNDAPI